MSSRIALISCALFFMISCEDATKEEEPVSTMVSTIAGGSDTGYVDGSGVEARFNWPMGLAQDQAGNLVVADSRNNAIRKITTEGVVSTLAGGTEGSANGTGRDAQFFLPTDVAFAANGDVYVAEAYVHRIRKISQAGVVTNFAGSIDGKQGHADGIGAEALFSAPAGIAIGADGNFYVVEASNYIRKITPDGTVSTFAGSGNAARVDGTGDEASFYNPNSIDADAQGNLYVTEYEQSGIRKITASGEVTSLNLDLKNLITWPSAIAIDKNGNWFLTSNYTYQVVRKNTDNSLSGLAGDGISSYRDGPGNVASFIEMWGIYIDKSGRNIYVSDKNRIRKIELSR